MQTDGSIHTLNERTHRWLSDAMDMEYAVYIYNVGVISGRTLRLFIGLLAAFLITLGFVVVSPTLSADEPYTVDTSDIVFDAPDYLSEKRYTENDIGCDMDPVHTYTWKYISATPLSPLVGYIGYLDAKASMTIEYPIEWYKSYRADNGTIWFHNYDLLITVDDPYLIAIADAFMEMTEGMNDFQRVDFVLKFVQSIPYENDDVRYGSDDYWKYPAEILWENCGDCEDKAFLFITLIRIMGYDAIPLFVEIDMPFYHGYHVAAGIVMDDTLGYAFEVDGKEYIYCECTAKYYQYPVGIKPFFYIVHEWNKQAVMKGYLRI